MDKSGLNIRKNGEQAKNKQTNVSSLKKVQKKIEPDLYVKWFFSTQAYVFAYFYGYITL
jgi:hypothetical protein